MQTGIDAHLETWQGWRYRYREGATPESPILVLLHGWTGDENSMWVFTRMVPEGYTILAPRAPHPAPGGGFSWRALDPGERAFPRFDQLVPVGRQLMELFQAIKVDKGLNSERFDLIGFSQGAAMAYTLLLAQPGRTGRLAALSGFLPVGAEVTAANMTLSGKNILVTHGRDDEIVPVEMARHAVAVFRQAGAQIQYCESDGGHKVSKECMEAIQTSFR